MLLIKILKSLASNILTATILFSWCQTLSIQSVIYSAMTSAHSNFSTYIAEGNNLYSKGSYNGAINKYILAAKYINSYSKVYYKLGLCYYNLKNYDAAIKYFNSSIKAHTDEKAAYFMEGKTLIQNKNKYKEGINYLNKYLKLNSSDIEGYYNKGLAYYYLHDNKTAMKMFDICLKMNPNSLGSYYMKAAVYYSNGKYNDAISILNKSLNINPKYVYSYFLLGNCYEKLKSNAAAIRNYSIALKLDPNYKYAANRIETLK